MRRGERNLQGGMSRRRNPPLAAERSAGYATRTCPTRCWSKGPFVAT